MNMNVLFYTILFMIGSVIGSFLAGEAEDIPKSLDLKKTHYSMRKHERFLTKLTYILVGGVSTIMLASIIRVNLNEFDFTQLIIYFFAIIYISILIVIAGIDRNYSKIAKEPLAFGIVCSILYMLYLSVADLASIYLNGIYLSIYIILLAIDTFLLRKFAKDSYIINTLLLFVMILVFTDLKTLTYTIVMSFLAINLYILFAKMKKNKGNKKIKISEIPVGYFIAASNIIVLFMVRIFENYCI